MNNRFANGRTVWLAIGLMAGCCLSYLWPHETVYARGQLDRNDQFVMFSTTATLDAGAEVVFLLDFLTGRLTGAVLNRQQEKFMTFYYRNVAADFQVDPDAKPKYAIIAGAANLQGRRGAQFAQSAIYVAELTSGRVIAYKFPYQNTNRVTPPIQLIPMDAFPFREATVQQ